MENASVAIPDPAPVTEDATGSFGIELLDPLRGVGDSIPSGFGGAEADGGPLSRAGEPARSLIELGSAIGINRGSTICGEFLRIILPCMLGRDCGRRTFRM